MWRVVVAVFFEYNGGECALFYDAFPDELFGRFRSRNFAAQTGCFSLVVEHGAHDVALLVEGNIAPYRSPQTCAAEGNDAAFIESVVGEAVGKGLLGDVGGVER